VHLGADARSGEIHAIEVTYDAIGDAPVQFHLLAQIPEDELPCSVSADDACDTKAWDKAIAHRQRYNHHSLAQK